MTAFKQFDSFELSKDINTTLQKGLIGVVLEVLAKDSFEVEFIKDDGTNYEHNGNFTFTIDSSYMTLMK